VNVGWGFPSSVPIKETNFRAGPKAEAVKNNCFRAGPSSVPIKETLMIFFIKKNII